MNAPHKKSSAAFWLGCVGCGFFIALIVVGGTMLWMLRRESRGPDRMALIPAGWRDSVLAWGTVPAEARRLAPPRTDTGNAAQFLHETPDGPWPWITLRRLELGRPLEASDSAVLVRVMTDPTLDGVARAARMRRFAVTAMALATEGQRDRLFGTTVPSLWVTPYATVRSDLLALRARQRAARGQRAAAMEDLRAVLGLGVMMVERNPSWAGLLVGRRLIARTANAMTALAATQGDTATQHAAARVASWAETERRGMAWMWFGFAMHPDSAFAAAADSALPFGFRAQMLLDAALASYQSSPTRAILGPDAATLRRVRTFAASPDPELAAVAVAADSALTSIRRIGRWTRLRTVLRAAER